MLYHEGWGRMRLICWLSSPRVDSKLTNTVKGHSDRKNEKLSCPNTEATGTNRKTSQVERNQNEC